MRDLNRVYRARRRCTAWITTGSGFEWLSWQDDAHSVLSYLRKNGDEHAVVVLNFTPVPRHGYRVGVPTAGAYREILNSDSSYYGGSNVGNGYVSTEPVPCMEQPALDRRDAAAARGHRAGAGLEPVPACRR